MLPLTILEAQEVHAEIMSLVTDPGLTTILRLQQEGTGTGAPVSASSLMAEESTIPSQSSLPTGSTQADQPEPTSSPEPPGMEVFPGSDSLIGCASSLVLTPGVNIEL